MHNYKETPKTLSTQPENQVTFKLKEHLFNQKLTARYQPLQNYARLFSNNTINPIKKTGMNTQIKIPHFFLFSLLLFITQKTRKPIPALPPIALFSIIGFFITRLL